MRRLFLMLLFFLTPVAFAQSDQTTTIRVWLGWDVPTDFETMLTPLFESGQYERVLNQNEANLIVDLTNGGGAITSRWVYVPVVPFNSIAETVSFIDIQRYWNGDLDALNSLSPDNTRMKLIVTSSTFKAMSLFLGEPAETVHIVHSTDLIDQLWEKPNTWSMVAFDDLTPALKALKLDGVSIFSDDVNLDSYPFTVQVAITGDNQAVGQAIDDLLAVGSWRGTNRDPNYLTRIVLSGVTALTRATAYAMETRGITLPGEQILPFVQDADLFHTSNEVPFSTQCPYPDPYAGTIFCADDKYIELLTYIGLNVIELTGNHINDYGPGALKHTLDLYDEAGMAYFGGGHTPDQARAPWITQHNTNTIAFIGCNVPGPFKAWVSDERPGAAPCDDVFLEQELQRLAGEVDFIIMTVQDYEYYRYDPPNVQINRFTNYATWGADVVIGSQAHQPQGFSLVPLTGRPPAFLHHGLGNLFFDQMADIGTRQMFMDKLLIYDGQLLGVELFTGLIEDYCCPRPMTAQERINFLTTIFTASGW